MKKAEEINVLIGCEESQAVCIEFRKLGFNAFSCDLLPCSGGHPEWHLQMDVFEAINLKKWNLIITFQPCTDIASSGAAWFERKRIDGSQEKSLRFFFEVWKYSDCSENPMGILNGGKYIKKWFPKLYEEMKDYHFQFKPGQIIQPYQYGHDTRKTTCLWTKNLPILKPTNIVEPVILTYSNGRKETLWHAKTGKGCSVVRSKTYPGIAKAMATQWGEFLLKDEPIMQELTLF